VIELSSTPDVIAALSRAGEIEARAYTLHGPVKDALEAAARRGAHVVVALEGQPFKNPLLAGENAKVVREMRAAGVDARLEDPVHAKTIVADGTHYFDDKNWAEGDLVLRTDAAAAASIPMLKHEALELERQLVNGAGPGDDAIVESESFGAGNPVYSALDAAAKRGLSPRLLVCNRELAGSAQERKCLDKLARDGVRVRVCTNTEKLAVAGDRAWIGSANATVAFGKFDMPDWGCSTADPAIVSRIADRLEAVWAGAREFRG